MEVFVFVFLELFYFELCLLLRLVINFVFLFTEKSLSNFLNLLLDLLNLFLVILSKAGSFGLLLFLSFLSSSCLVNFSLDLLSFFIIWHEWLDFNGGSVSCHFLSRFLTSWILAAVKVVSLLCIVNLVDSSKEACICANER